ncbi:MAG: hypothetical protein HC846_07820 [Blastocatellia bacterium]|nr:hypothetical protein [Blastocatellia bacterium]
MAESYFESIRNANSGRYLTLLRIGPDLKGEERGILKVMEGNTMIKAFSTIENDKTLRYSSLRMGVYEFKHSWKKFNLDGTQMKNPIKCLRPTESRIQKVLIHRAFDDDANTLAGCIAPGTWGTLYSFEDSEKAVEELFVLLGGHCDEKTVTLNVLSNASGVGYGETKENWWRTK